MSEFIKYTKVATAFLVAGIGASACGGNASSEQAKHHPVPVVKKVGRESIKYLPNGTVSISGYEVGANGLYYSPVIELCQGNMFVAETANYEGNGPTSSLYMKPDSPYCKDGKLTPSDFALPSKAHTQNQ